MILTGKAKLAGVMGWPVTHSLSPRLHGYWLEQKGIDGAYVPLSVRREDFASVTKSLGRMGFRGVNVTVPHKESALAICDEVTPVARRIGAVNTMTFQDDGSIHGTNTDAFGFLENLKTGAEGKWRPEEGPAVVIGAGGAARAVCAALADAGVPEVRLVNRTMDRAEALAADIGGNLRVIGLPKLNSALEGALLLVNTTTLGMQGAPPLEVDLAALSKKALVTDIVYAPLETNLLKNAKARGNPVVDGLGMLLHQARPGFEKWFGEATEVTTELRDFMLLAANS